MLKIFVTSLLLLSQACCFMNPIPTLKMSLVNPSDRRQFIGYVGKAFATTPLALLTLRKVNALTPDEINQINIYEQTLPSVCYITTDYNVTDKQAQGLDRNPKGVGSGFVYDNDGHIVTNFHVINWCINATVKFTNIDGDTIEYIPRLVGYDADKDLAVLKIDTAKLKPIPVSSNKDIKIGQYCYAIGNPFGKPFSFTMGIISGKGRDMTSPSGRRISDIIQSDVPINKGNSGGCLLDSSGKLIGVNTAIFGGDVSTGISLSVSVDTVKESVNNIIKNGIIDHATLGIEYFTQLPSKSEAFKSGLSYVESGVIILKVMEGSAAAEAGLRGLEKKEFGKAALGDVIIAVNDKPIKNADDMLTILDTYKPNDKIKLKVLRGNELTECTLDVILSSSKDGHIGLQQVK